LAPKRKKHVAGPPKTELARRILEVLARGGSVSTGDALQLRNWAVCPEDAVLPLDEIAPRILKQNQDVNAKDGEQR
jgi:hypothetical protein